jgi:hypothetical protein
MFISSCVFQRCERNFIVNVNSILFIKLNTIRTEIENEFDTGGMFLSISKFLLSLGSCVIIQHTIEAKQQFKENKQARLFNTESLGLL